MCCSFLNAGFITFPKNARHFDSSPHRRTDELRLRRFQNKLYRYEHTDCSQRNVLPLQNSHARAAITHIRLSGSTEAILKREAIADDQLDGCY